jgi:hypothetical protein
VAPGDEVIFLFYYSGHGTKEFLKLGREAYPLARLKQRIDQVPSKLRIGVLDACQSGAITRIKGAKVVKPFLIEAELKSAGSILIASSAEDENSQESDQLKGSFFTHHWHTALRGAGDASGDGRVSLLEAYQYAYNKTLVGTKGTRGGAQHPSAQFKLDTEGDVILTDLNNGMGGIRFQGPLGGELLVANSKAEVMAEFAKEPGQDAFLALPPGRYRVFQREGRLTRHLSVTLEGAEVRKVEDRDLVSEALLASNSKGGSEDPAVELPWKVGDWSTQRPWELGAGYCNNGFFDGYLVRYGRKIGGPVAAIGTFTMNHIYGYQSWAAEEVFQWDLRLGVQVSKFLTRNLEFLGTPFYRISYREEDPGSRTYNICGDDICPSPGYRPASFQPAAGLGMHAGIRFWLFSRFSFQLHYGTEWVFEDFGFSADPLTFLPSLHF